MGDEARTTGEANGTDELNAIAAELARRARDAAYVAVGIGVLGLQRAQTVRYELVKQGRLDEEVTRLRTGLATGTHQVGELLDGTISAVSDRLAPLAAQLRGPTRELAGRVRTQIGAAGAQLRQLAAPEG